MLNKNSKELIQIFLLLTIRNSWHLTSQIPVNNGEATFIDSEGMPSDRNLWLTGMLQPFVGR
jgi:hypothetical protein